jgi:cyclophilin family peptidyl-prolyl cis-trans isomerase
MRAALPVILCTLAFLAPQEVLGQTPAKPAPLPILVLDTAKGTIEIELFPDEAPKSVAHITALVKRGFYRGLRFHYVNTAVAQVGDPNTRDMTKKGGWGANASGTRIGVAEYSKRKFVRGSVGLDHRDGAQNSDSHIFMAKATNSALDGKYTMIGRVVRGLDVLDKLQTADLLKNASLK